MRRHMSHITQRLASFSTTIKKKVWTSRFEAVSMKLKGDRLLFEKQYERKIFCSDDRHLMSWKSEVGQSFSDVIQVI